MTDTALEQSIDQAWEDRDSITPQTTGAARDAIEAALEGLDSGTLRVAEKGTDGWTVNQWLKKAVLLSFRIYDMAPLPGGPSFPGLGESAWFDKVPSKFAGWDEEKF
ncbi:MAG: 2,3,4,5-tetrahydropyridine-2,6-dicarboxylate N-succinyltransferase, partial [Rhodospirillaceae bacterium]|nr:2,3,4,5-tetrahydropyridine-2,6-dicarboxylate N-succinyltransferase [Rhodospirillaceae bacterium]